jgi:SAM-dependent methyltransferase
MAKVLNRLRSLKIAAGIFQTAVFMQNLFVTIPWLFRSKGLRFFSQFQRVGQNPRAVYVAFLAHFKFWLDPNLKAHRRYFVREKRGFGEDPFHSMWLSLFEEFRFSNCLEIGVYRGQTLSLWRLLQEKLGIDGTVTGCTPLTELGDLYSKYSTIDYRADIHANFEAVGAKQPILIPFASQSPEAKQALDDSSFDLAYVDGSHNFSDVLEDIKTSKKILRPGGILVLDDAALYLGYTPMLGAFGGHDGPSRAAISGEVAGLNLLGTCGHNVVFQLPN